MGREGGGDRQTDREERGERQGEYACGPQVWCVLCHLSVSDIFLLVFHSRSYSSQCSCSSSTSFAPDCVHGCVADWLTAACAYPPIHKRYMQAAWVWFCPSLRVWGEYVRVCVSGCACVRESGRVCVCVCVWGGGVCACMCVCVCERERERERERECVWVCVRACVCAHARTYPLSLLLLHSLHTQL